MGVSWLTAKGGKKSYPSPWAAARVEKAHGAALATAFRRRLLPMQQRLRGDAFSTH
ncbi:hypothetical protein [Serratia marcescens]|uniref:hypothetical protein n=1 Tax=Serratia marcescens TaxID=615 RepID=UPI0016530E10|nr:hypothetical protein [Serratia marcescens]